MKSQLESYEDFEDFDVSEIETESVAERENQKKNVLTKKIFLVFLWLFISSVVVFGGYKIISQKNVLPIKEISISGEFNQVLARELHRLVVDGVQGNFFTLSVENIYQKFYELPWVEQIWVHRVWPDKINIEIREHKPVAILKDKGLLNEKGKVFTSNIGNFGNSLPVFSVASEYEQDAIVAYQKYDKMLRETDLTIQQFNFDSRKSQTLFLSKDFKIKLGRVDVEKRLNRFIQAYKVALSVETKKIDSIDLRYTNGFAVKWKKA